MVHRRPGAHPRTLGIAGLGGATLDDEENHLIKKLLTALGVVQLENQARVCHSSTVAGLGTSSGRGGGTTFLQDLQNSERVVIQGSNVAEAHPVGFQRVMEPKARGDTVVHIDPRSSRTSAMADLHAPFRAGTGIVWLGALVNHVLTTSSYLRDYVVACTNAATRVRGWSAACARGRVGVHPGRRPRGGQDLDPDPTYVVVPQRERMAAREAEQGDRPGTADRRRQTRRQRASA